MIICIHTGIQFKEFGLSINAAEDVEKREPSCTIGGNVDWYSLYGEQYGESLKKKLGIKLSYETAIPLLGIYPEKTTILKDTATPIFIAALFTIARTWIDMDMDISIYRRMDKEVMVRIYNGILLIHKEEWIWVSSTEVD